MPPASPLADSFLRSGKVRDLYAVGADRLLLVASDRLSAFDVVLPTPIPDKGRVLTGVSRFWFERTADLVANHLVGVAPEDIPGGRPDDADELRGRMMLCRRVEPLPIEVIVRGYLAGSGWKDYGRTGAVCGIPLPAGLRESDRLEPSVFSPATKAESGHDENIPVARLRSIVGVHMAAMLEGLARTVYERGRALAAERGLIVADTKLEFGRTADGQVLLIDEVLTPDSSRFWPAEGYAPGRPQPSFDKQPLRDYLAAERAAGRWNGEAPAPALPPAVIAATSARYLDAFRRITGKALDIPETT